MPIDEKALQAAIQWYWRAGAISENIPRGCVRVYLEALPKTPDRKSAMDHDRRTALGICQGIVGMLLATRMADGHRNELIKEVELLEEKLDSAQVKYAD